MNKKSFNTQSCYYYYSDKADMADFYRYFDLNTFNDITMEEVERLKSYIEVINSKRIIADSDNYFNSRMYTKLMNHIKRNLTLYNITSKSQMYILFMLCIDPDFSALYPDQGPITIPNLKYNMILKFGVFDLNLIKMENWFVKKFYSDENTNRKTK